MQDGHFDHRARRTFLRWLAGGVLIGVTSRLSTAAPRDAERSQVSRNRETPAAGASITLFLCGDVMTGRGVDQVLPHPGDPRLYEPYVRDARQYVQLAEAVNGPIATPVDFAYIWGDALEALERRSPDIRLINLETAITTSEAPWPQKGIHYRMHPPNLPVLSAAAVQCCALANNHVLDWGYSGLAETLESLRGAGIATAGAGNNLAEACAPAILAVPHKGRVIVLALGHRSSGIPRSWAAQPKRPGVCLLSDLSERTAESIGRWVSELKQSGDLLVVSIHWGENWGYEIPLEQRRFAHALIDKAGVDLVHGHSSHHVKGIEVYRGRLVLYGCGDFFNDYEGISGYEEFRSDLSLMYFPTFEPASGRLTALRMIPTQVRRFRVKCAAEADMRWLLDRLNRECERFGARVDIESDDSLRLSWE
jgi:poly-gamma-glutamate capsule biosynthesis protein CapA/YwtB (metallophosphatase superfamily)